MIAYPILRWRPLRGIALSLAASAAIAACSTGPRPIQEVTTTETAPSPTPSPRPERPAYFNKRPDSKCVSVLDRMARDRLKNTELPATMTGQEGQKPVRTALFHLLLPKDQKQYAKLNEMALIAVRVYGQNPESIRLSKLTLVEIPKEKPENGKTYRLPFVFPFHPIYRLPESDPLRSSLGEFETTGYAFVPIALFYRTGHLQISFEGGAAQASLVVARLPINPGLDPKLRFISKKKLSAKTDEDLFAAKPPDPKTVLDLLHSHYCLGS
ncbi:MAG: hypothetical protein AAB425_06090 [Bdellovibrionota bacterium]|mgnify:CR=1 FL=1